MRTAIVSDLHLGSLIGTDLARDGEVRRALLDGLEGADRVVLLGDTFELRDLPPSRVLDRAGPFFADFREAVGEIEVVIVPGNHDHGLADGVLDMTPDLGLEQLVPAADLPETEAIAALLPGCEVKLAYPGIHLRDDVYATHGHYLDCHTTLPTFEVLGAAASIRFTGGMPVTTSPGDYERALGAVNGLAEGFARAGGPEGVLGGSSPSTRAYTAMTRNATGARSVAIRAGIPAAVWAVGRALGRDFNLDLTPPGMSRTGVTAMRETVRRLGIEADHVVFGHTHHPGPGTGRGGTAPEWSEPGGPALHNTGSWVYSPGMLAPTAAESYYWPGTFVTVDDEGPPVLEEPLADWDHGRLRDAVRRLQQA